jgi:hypothetical protein
MEKYLDRDLFDRTPGQFIRWDGTYSVANKLMDGIDELDSVGVLLILFGEYGDIVSFAFAPSEGPDYWQVLHWFLRRHCKNKGYQLVQEVIGGWDDLGSTNFKNPKDHWFAKVWPNLHRAPWKDVMHGVSLVTKSTHGGSHPMHAWFCQRRMAAFSSIVIGASRKLRQHTRGRIRA